MKCDEWEEVLYANVKDEVEQRGIEAIRQAARDVNKNDAKILRKIIEEETRKKIEVLRESLVVSNECVRKCGHDWSEE